jgi:TldD protein
LTQLVLPKGMANARPRLADLVARIGSKAGYASALLSERSGLDIKLEDKDEAVRQAPPTAGSVLSSFDGESLNEWATGGFETADLEAGTGELVARLGRPGGLAVDPGPAANADFVTAADVPLDSLSLNDKLARLRDLHQRARRLDRRIINVRLLCRERSEISVFCNQKADLAQNIQRVQAYLMIFVQDKLNTRYDLISHDATAGWEALEFSDDELQAVVDRAIALLSARRIDPGEYTVVTTPGVSGTVCHESFGHGVETDMFLKERAKAAEYLGKRIGSPLVNIWDDPSAKGAFGSYFFDDEGKLAEPTQIAAGGIFKQGITDLYSSMALGLPRTANGRRQDFGRKPYARMSNTYFAAGDTPLPDLIGQADNGIYLERWTSGMEDPRGWGIQVTCHYGHRIRHGQITDELYHPIGLSGYVPDVLGSVSAVSDEWALEGGICGKGHKEYVFVSAGGPHLLLRARLS